MKTTLYIVRHGQTEWNRLGLLQGQLASPLTEEGIADTEAFRQEITELEPDVVYSSDQDRALTTAKILTGDLHREIHIHEGLREMNFGVFQAKSWENIEEEMPELFEVYRQDDPDFVIPEGESHNQFHKRAVNALIEITEAHPGKRILIVSHGGTINKMLGYVEGMRPSANRFFHSKNLALNILEFENGRYRRTTEAELLEYSAIH
ncbi:histidine phosphatase family protein [Spirochaeta isovalerica]|uniref:Broad specificity phosphatase PhoE n=1 Tax=Spirochaeta isovalerica TaxID=150 RepID=A0A841R9C9_9SPIO|nr:histidine phosphatase family protein [Spirochaeta isovalerica]MBB6479318.1 broad specificity phosphatase PhoE [Spirochaeta isovalerica]